MAYLNEEEINNIRDNANIVDIINNYVPLEKKGNNYIGICPFHEDHSPSMVVNPNLKIFKCFVCGTGGNVFTFIQKFENVSYPEAIKKVADHAGIDIKIDSGNSYNQKFKDEYAAMDLSLKYFQNNLATQSGIDAKKYLNNRGIDDRIIKEFKIGLSPSGNKLKEFFESKNSSLEKAVSVGILNKDGINYYDTFVNRIMIPIFDNSGNLVAYTGRIYNEENQSKYINSKETIIYKKSNVLFNYYKAKEKARLKKEIIIVEGNMDAITMYCYGIENVVALMGVAISKFQIEALKRLNSKVVLMLDSDNAGSIATMKVGDEIQKSGLDLYVVRLSDAKDPDEYVHKFGKERLLDNIKNASKYIDFKLDVLKEGLDLNKADELAKYIELVLSSLEGLSDIEKEVIISKICNEYHLDKEVIKKGIVITSPVQKKEVVIAQKKQTRYELASNELIYAMLLNKDYYTIYMKNLGYLLNKIQRDTVAIIGSYIKNHGDISISGFIDYAIRYEDILNYVNEIMLKNNEETIAENEFYDILFVVKKLINEEEIKNLKLQIVNEKDVGKKLELIDKLTKLKKGDMYEGN